MTAPADDPFRALAALIARVDRTLSRGDDDRARAEAADEVDELRAIAAATDGGRLPGLAGLDVAKLAESLQAFAAWLRAPSAAGEANAKRAMADLQSVFAPLAAPDPSALAAARAQHRQHATAATAAYLRDHPVAPFTPPTLALPPRRELPALDSLGASDPDEPAKP